MGAESIMKFVMEKQHHWIQVGAPFLILGLVLVVFYYCCCHRCRGRRAVKLMKAPGGDHLMDRSHFEDNPGGYFRGLRARARAD